MNKFILLISLAVFLAAPGVFAQDADTSGAMGAATIAEIDTAQMLEPLPELLLGDESDGSRAVPGHLIRLLDDNDLVVLPDAHPVVPFSTKNTCGECHNYDIIDGGWHFNAAEQDVDPGRRGQPWIYLDRSVGVQYPLSYRSWEGAIHPDKIGMAPFEFIRTFGRQMPGGSVGEVDSLETPEYFFRWMVSGKLQINCLACHDAESAQDMAEYAAQVLKENYRWAATASSGFAEVYGAAKAMPDNYDLYTAPRPEDPGSMPPTTVYDETRFDTQDKVFMDIVADIPANKCYFCHSTRIIDEDMTESWHSDEDIHLVSGMTCVDCHRNGLDHMMVRGYEGEEHETIAAETLTCEGCHIDNDDHEIPGAGRLGAPKPVHAGIPPVHFEEMTCTACHSGPWPKDNAVKVKTSMSHAIGLHGANKQDEALPHIYAPVFARGEGGKIEPHKLMWPSYWGRLLDDETVEPYSTEFVAVNAGKVFLADTLSGPYELATISDSMLVDALSLLAEADTSEGKPVYITGGKLYSLNGTRITDDDHPAAEAYTWAFAHDVRPAEQSLGIRGCNDCHSPSAAFYFGDVETEPTYTAETDTLRGMTHFMDVQSASSWFFSMTFFFRPTLKAIIIISFVVLALLFFAQLFGGIRAMVKSVYDETEGKGAKS